MKKIICMVFILCALLVSLVCCNSSSDSVDNDNATPKSSEEKYNAALAYIEDKDYESAYTIFKELGDYKDSEKLIKRFHYVIVTSEYEDDFCEYFYNESNLPSQVITTSSDGTKEIIEITYDSNGNLIRMVEIDPDGDKYTYDYTYDANGNLIKEVESYSNGDKYTYDYTYDEKGNKIKQVYTNRNGDKSTYDYTYDEKGNKIKEVNTNPYGDKSTTDYTYDEKGNLIKGVNTDFDGNKYTTDYTHKFVYIPYDISELADKTQEVLSAFLSKPLDELE